MNLAAVMDQLGAALKQIEGLRVFPYWADKVIPPAALVAWPEQVTFDATFGRGSDRAEVPITVLVGRVNARSSRDVLAGYVDGGGDRSVKAAVDGHDAGGVWDSATVTRWSEFVGVTNAGVEYLSATAYVDIIGKGGE